MFKKKISSPKPKLIIGYVRVSTGDRQELSIDAQETRIRANAVSRGLTLDEIIIDRESAKNLKRDGVQRLLGMVANNEVSQVIIWKLDRLTRSISDLSILTVLFEKKDVALVSLNETLDTSTATGRMMSKMITLFSEWERETISERTVSVLDHKRFKGERMGNVPYGYQAGLNIRNASGQTVTAAVLQVNVGEQAVIAEIAALRASGNSLKAISDSLNSAGTKTRRGTDWKFQYVDAILKQARIKIAA